jgi:hypothetical protein
MKTQLIKNGRKSLLHGALFAVIAYGALVLNSEPAYAGTCNIGVCGTHGEACVTLCNTNGGGFVAFYCPFTLNTWLCRCKEGELQGPC